jgi:4-hydroxy-3-methylbut-2-en-1-yl diphosphate reductase
MKITINKGSGCCFGVVSAIGSAEAFLETNEKLYCLGDIVHNNEELIRLNKKGLIFIDHEIFKTLQNTTVLIRAHGEPPETYQIALQNNIQLIDASCPVVLKLQANIRKAYDETLKGGGQVVIFGKKGHAEVIGLLGQTYNKAIVVSDQNDLINIDYSKPVHLFAQTTQNTDAFKQISEIITARMQEVSGHQKSVPVIHNTICKLVGKRAEDIAIFARQHDIILFVSDLKSSNGKYLFDICKIHNVNSYFISSEEDIRSEIIQNAEKIGICGATSTPEWLLNKIADAISILK